MQKEKIKLTQKDAKNSPAGGVVVGKRNGQTMIYDDASVGGYFVGKTHDEGGIKMVNKSNGQQLEVQGSEVIITAPAVADQTKNEFNGKMMTNREILSQINVNGGGVAFAKDGMEIPKRIKRTGASYKYGGKTMTDHEICKYITGGGVLKDGGYVSYKDKYNRKYKYKKGTSHSLAEISKDTGVSIKGIQRIYNKGIGAFKTNPSSVRPNVNSKEQWAMARVYSAVMGGKASKVDATELKMNHGGRVHRDSLVRDSKSGNTPARDLNNYNDVLDVNADDMVGADSGLFADGGDVKPYDANMEGDSVSALFDNGGNVKEVVEYVTIASYSDNPFNKDSTIRFYYFIDFKIWVKDLYANFGATNKREVHLCINNDYSTSKFTIKISQGKNTNSNFNPFTGTFSDLVKNLKKYSEYSYDKFDWNSWGGVKAPKTTTSQTNSQKGKTLIKEELEDSKIWIGDDLRLRDLVMQKLIEIGLQIDKAYGDKDLSKTENIYIKIYTGDFVVHSDLKANFDSQGVKEIFTSDLGISSAFATPNATATTSGKFSSGDIDAFNQIDEIVKSYGITNVYITEWHDDKSTLISNFDIVDTLTGDVFQLRRYKKNLGVQDDDVNIDKSKALIKDYLEWKKTQPSVTASASATTTPTSASAPFDFTQTKIWIGNNPELSKRVQEKAIQLGWDWWSGIGLPANLDFNNLFFDIGKKITSTSDETAFDSFKDFREIDEADLFGNFNTTSTASQTSTQNAPSEDEDWVKKFTADLDKLDTYLPNDKDFAPELSKEQKDLNALIKLLPSFQQSKYAVERAKILNEIKKIHYKLTYEGFIKPNEASAVSTDLFTPQGLLDYYFTQATQNPTAELEPACELPTPNGEKSKLPMSAYLNVRTSQFKNWFGDWERAYETGNYVDCSKMIDPDTKEPKIYFHGVRKYVPNFGQFSNMGQGVVRPYGAFEPPSFPASYFAGEEDYAKFYGGVAENMPTPSADYKPFIYKTFLSVKNPISLLPLNFMLSYKDFMDYIYVGYGVKVEPNQDLLTQLGNDVTKKNPMWIYVRRDIGFIEMLKDYGYDAIFQLGDIPVFLPDGTVEPDRTKHLQEVEYLTFYPSQVKSATVKKSFYFDFFNDIRFKNGGYVCI